MALLCSFVSKITNSKHQISNKSQIQNHKFQTRAKDICLFFCLLFRISVIGIYLLFVFCYLCFVIWDFNMSMNFQQSKSPLGIIKAWFSGPGFL